jgi:hypothetical protein
MSEDNPLVGDEKVSAVLEALGRSGAKGVNRKDFGGDEFAVEAISESVAAGCGDDQPECVDRFSAMDGDHADRGGTNQPHQSPDQSPQTFVHACRALCKI